MYVTILSYAINIDDVICVNNRTLERYIDAPNDDFQHLFSILVWFLQISTYSVKVGESLLTRYESEVVFWLAAKCKLSN